MNHNLPRIPVHDRFPPLTSQEELDFKEEHHLRGPVPSALWFAATVLGCVAFWVVAIFGTMLISGGF